MMALIVAHLMAGARVIMEPCSYAPSQYVLRVEVYDKAHRHGPDGVLSAMPLVYCEAKEVNRAVVAVVMDAVRRSFIQGVICYRHVNEPEDPRQWSEVPQRTMKVYGSAIDG